MVIGTGVQLSKGNLEQLQTLNISIVVSKGLSSMRKDQQPLLQSGGNHTFLELCWGLFLSVVFISHSYGKHYPLETSARDFFEVAGTLSA